MPDMKKKRGVTFEMEGKRVLDGLIMQVPKQKPFIMNKDGRSASQKITVRMKKRRR